MTTTRTAHLTPTQRATWERAGRDAFAAGITNLMSDPKVAEAVAASPAVGSTLPIMRAWNRGWHAANAAAPVD